MGFPKANDNVEGEIFDTRLKHCLLLSTLFHLFMADRNLYNQTDQQGKKKEQQIDTKFWENVNKSRPHQFDDKQDHSMFTYSLKQRHRLYIYWSVAHNTLLSTMAQRNECDRARTHHRISTTE